MRPMERNADVFARRCGSQRTHTFDSVFNKDPTRGFVAMTPRAWGTRRAKASAVHTVNSFHRAYEASARRAPSPIDGPAGRCLRQSTFYLDPTCESSALDWTM